jgi:hypothetical protein
MLLRRSYRKREASFDLVTSLFGLRRILLEASVRVCSVLSESLPFLYHSCAILVLL